MPTDNDGPLTWPAKDPGVPPDLLGDEFSDEFPLPSRYQNPYKPAKHRNGMLVLDEGLPLKAGIDNIDLLKPPPSGTSSLHHEEPRIELFTANQSSKAGSYWGPAIPEPIHGLFWSKVCGECYHRLWTMDGYRGHWLLVHHHQLGEN